MIDVEETTDSRLLTRRRLLKGAGGAAGLVAFGGAAFGAARAFHRRPRVRVPSLHSFASPADDRVRVFVSRPDLRPPAVSATRPSGSPGYIFLGPGASGGAQAGPLLVDEQGEPEWFQPISRELWLSNFRRAQYRGRPVLTWWEGRMTWTGSGRGEGVIFDGSYRELARVRAGNGRHMDMHEFVLTPQGTALFFCYPETVTVDLSSIGGPSNGTVLQSVLQEVDVQSGRVLLEWQSLEYIPVEDSYQPHVYPYDYIHANSIAITPDGNLLVSARCTWALYKLDRRTGEVIWRLGGKRSDFELGDGARFSWQHDAWQQDPSTITLFDDGSAGYDDGSPRPINTESQSRGVVLEVDETSRTARLARSYRHPRPLLANAMGSFQKLPDGHVLIGWGSEPCVSEFSADGKLLNDWSFGSKQTSYRAYRFPWAGQPAEPPAIVARHSGRRGQSTLYASWNGATAVARWLVHAGPRGDALQPVGIATRRGFETVIPLPISGSFFQVTALDSRDRPLASSEVVRL